MALAVDSEMAANTGAKGPAGSPATLTFSFTNNAGTLLVVGVASGNTSSGFVPVSGITYNGVALTKFVSVTYDGASHNQSEASLWYLKNPATGANNVVVTWTGASGGATGGAAGAISFTGNDTTNPIVAGSGQTNFRESAGTTATVTSATTTVGNIVVAQMATGSGYSSTSQTLSWSANDNTHSAGGNGALTRTAGTGGTINFSDTITSDFMGMCCVEIAAAGGGGGGSALVNPYTLPLVGTV